VGWNIVVVDGTNGDMGNGWNGIWKYGTGGIFVGKNHGRQDVLFFAGEAKEEEK